MTPHSSPLPAWLNMLATQAEAKYLEFVAIRLSSSLALPTCHSELYSTLHSSSPPPFSSSSPPSSLSSFCYNNYDSYNYNIGCLYHTIPPDFFYSLTPNVDPSVCPSTFSLPKFRSVPPLPYLIQPNLPHLFIHWDIIRPSSRQRGGLTIPVAHLAISGNTFVYSRDRAKSSRHCCEVVQYSVKATTAL